MKPKSTLAIVSAGIVFAATLAVVTSINLRGRDASALPGPEKKKQVMAQAERASTIPSQLGPMDLLRMSEGPEAIDRFVRFSGRQVQLIDAVFAEYEGTAGRSRLWIGWLADSLSARQTVDKLCDDIVVGGSPFSNIQEGIFDQTPVFEFSGLSQKHAYFASGSRAVWFSADTDVYQRTLYQLLDRLSR